MEPIECFFCGGDADIQTLEIEHTTLRCKDNTASMGYTDELKVIKCEICGATFGVSGIDNDYVLVEIYKGIRKS